VSYVGPILASLLPIRINLREKPVGKHREDDAVDLLHCKLTGARLLIKGLRLQLDDKDREHEAAIRRIDDRHAEVVRGLEAQLADANRRLDIACKAETAVTQTQEMPVEEIRRHCTPVPLHQSPQARRPEHVPAWAHRDEPEPAA
jgi:hypothetical protein